MDNLLKLVETNVSIIKIFFISIYTIYTVKRITNQENKMNLLHKVCVFILILIISYVHSKIKQVSNILYSTIFLIIMLSIVVSKFFKKAQIYSILVTIISFCINYIIFLCSVLIVTFTNNILLDMNSRIVDFILLLTIYSLLLMNILKIKKIKKGLIFLQNKIGDEYFNLIILNLSITILLLIILSSNYRESFTINLMLTFIIFSIIMFTTIQKSLQLYYKQKLLEQELNKTKEELASKIKDNEELEKENIEISKKAHTLTHKQKSLAHKIEEMMMNSEISKEEVADVRERLNEIGKELYKEKTTTELDKTGIPQIDDMLKFMQSECSENKIDFELQLKGNIHYVTNNLISKEDLETLLADHIKNAIIAINHTDNINRSILVKLGKIDETYGLYIYDSGIEFEKETLENLGKKPSTTHKDEGGTGMGFMNTFDTLRKCNASLIIEEFNKPEKDNYTKAIMIKFDNKNEFKIKSYRENEMVTKSTL